MTYRDAAAALRAFENEANVHAGVCGVSTALNARDRAVLPSRVAAADYLAGYSSIFVVAVGNGKIFDFKPDGKRRGLLNCAAVGRDYHLTVAEVAERLRQRLEEAFGAFKSRVHVDGGPLPERFIALSAGLGWVGRNRLFVTERFGSFCNLGLLVTDLAVEGIPEAALGSLCGECELCVKACTAGALSIDGGYDAERCVPFITRKKGELTDFETEAVKGRLYGCDACADVCPYNVGKRTLVITDIEEACPDADALAEMDKETFERRFREHALYWRGLGVLKRNAALVPPNGGVRHG